MQQPPIWTMYAYAAAGALMLWGQMAMNGRKTHFLSDILIRLIPHEGLRKVIEPLVFIAFGTWLIVGIINPTTERQAFAAGLGWTGLASK